jgi:hypothetical protein
MKKEGGGILQVGDFCFVTSGWRRKNESQETEGTRLLDFTHDRVISIRYNCTEVVVHLYCEKVVYQLYTLYTVFEVSGKRRGHLIAAKSFWLQKGVIGVKL